MFEQTFKNIDDIHHKDAGCSSELDNVEQTSRQDCFVSGKPFQCHGSSKCRVVF